MYQTTTRANAELVKAILTLMIQNTCYISIIRDPEYNLIYYMILSKPVNSYVLFVYDLSRMGYVIHVLP